MHIGSQMEDSYDTIGLLPTVERAHRGDFVIYDIKFKLEMVQSIETIDPQDFL